MDVFCPQPIELFQVTASPIYFLGAFNSQVALIYEKKGEQPSKSIPFVTGLKCNILFPETEVGASMMSSEGKKGIGRSGVGVYGHYNHFWKIPLCRPPPQRPVPGMTVAGREFHKYIDNVSGELEASAAAGQSARVIRPNIYKLSRANKFERKAVPKGEPSSLCGTGCLVCSV